MKSRKMNRLCASLLVISLAFVAANAARLQEQSNIFSFKDKTNTIQEEDLPSEEVNSSHKDLNTQVEQNQFPAKNNANVTDTPGLAEAMSMLLNAFRRVMPCGVESLGIPVMAPFRVPHVPVNVSEELLKVNGEIKNLVISGIDNFLLVGLATNSSNNRTTFDYIYKDIQILGDADIHIDADLAGFRFIQHIKSALDFEIINMRVTGGVTIGRNNNGGMHFSDVELYVQVGGIISNIFNAEWSVAVNNFMNEYLADVSKLFLQTNRNFLSELVSNYATPLANQAFEKVTYTDYIKALVEGIKMYNEMTCVP